MDIHKNARLSFRSREALARFVVDKGATRKAAAAAFRLSVKTAGKWVARFRLSGIEGLLDCSSRPHRSPRRLASSLAERVVEMRRTHMPGYEIARRTGTSPASVSRILRHARLSRWRDLNPPPPIQR
jgi:transposase